jgi:hypothetical protein
MRTLMSENFARDRIKPVSDGFSSSRKCSGIPKDLRIGRRHGDRIVAGELKDPT